MCAGVATTCLNQWDCNVSFLMDRVRYVGSRPTVTVTQRVTSAPACWLAYIAAHASASHRSEMRWRDAEMQLNNILASFLPCARTVLFTCCPMSTHYNTKHVTNITTKRSVLIGHDKVKFWVAESSGAWLYKQVNGLRSTLSLCLPRLLTMIHQAWSNDPANRLKPEHPHTWDDKLHSFHCDAVDKVVRCKTCSYHAFVSPIPTNIAKVTWHQCDKPAKCSICFRHFSLICTRHAIFTHFHYECGTPQSPQLKMSTFEVKSVEVRSCAFRRRAQWSTRLESSSSLKNSISNKVMR